MVSFLVLRCYLDDIKPLKRQNLSYKVYRFCQNKDDIQSVFRPVG